MDKRYGHTVSTAQRKLIRSFIANEHLIRRDGNVCSMDKAFVVNSVLGWFLQQRSKNKITLTEMQYYVNLLQEYIDGRVDLSWNNQMLEVLIKE